jgi:hypothetical protein
LSVFIYIRNFKLKDAKMWNALIIILPLLALILSGCDSTAKDAWVNVIKKCAIADTIDEAKLLYFGPSNTVGPGSLWRKDIDGKSYGLRIAEETLLDNKKIVNRDESPAQCIGQYATETEIGPKLSFTSALSPVSAEVEADFKRAKSISAKAGEIRWYTVQEKPFEDYIDNLPASNPLKEDINKGNRFVMRRALMVSGYSAEIKFDSSVAAELEGKYFGPLPAKLVGNLGAGIRASWRGGTTLVLESKAPFFVAGELHPWIFGHFRAEGSTRINPAKEIVGKDQVPVFIDSP